jgi:sulfide:quinone oxidoreductase
MLNETDEITVVSDRPHFSFTPSNPWVAMGKRKPEDIQLDLTTILPKHKIDFVLGRAVKLEPSANNLRLEDGTVLSYDYLIIATGPRLAFEEVPGLKEFGESVCTTPHASKAAEALDQLVASPGPVVVGATQGASCFGPAYEYALLLQNTLKERGGKQLVNQCPITFVTSEPNVGHLGLGGVGDSEQILTEIFENKHIEALTNTKTLLVKKYSVVVEQFDEKGKVIGQQSIPSKMTMLIPPFHGHDVWKAVPGLTDKIGMLLVNEKQQSLRYPNIFGVGVCVHLPPPERTALPMGSPKTGYMIESQGTAAVKNIHSLIAGIDIHSVATLNGVCITDFGDSGAVFVTIPQFHPRRIDATIHNPAIIAAKITFEKYFLHKIKSGNTDPVYEKYMLKLVGIERTFEV